MNASLSDGGVRSICDCLTINSSGHDSMTRLVVVDVLPIVDGDSFGVSFRRHCPTTDKRDEES